MKFGKRAANRAIRAKARGLAKSAKPAPLWKKRDFPLEKFSVVFRELNQCEAISQ
jgi:hypothetical protein